MAGLLDGTDAIIFSRLALGVAPRTVFQYIASGLLGIKSFSGGWHTTALGIGLHFLIAVGAAATYYAVCVCFSGYYRKPYAFGPAFGVAVYFFMHYLVLPLSAAPERTIKVTGLEVLNLVIAHALLVGLPIALIARRSVAGLSNVAARRTSRASNVGRNAQAPFQLSDDRFFVEKVWDMVGLYLNPPDMVAALCIDEKLQTKASEPKGPGYVEGVSHNHVPFGTTTLLGALNLVAGTMIGLPSRRRRHEEYLKFLEHIAANVPKDLSVHLLVENYAVHKHPQVQNWLAVRPLFRVHFVRGYGSWLDQIEIWFNIIAQTTILGAAFRREKELTAKIDHFVRTYDAEAGPFVWTAAADSILEKIERHCEHFPGTQR